MKRLIILLLLVVLSACTTQNEINQGDEDMIQSECNISSKEIELTQTKTIDAKTLWEHASVCEGLIYNDGVITLDQDIEEATYISTVFHLPEYQELVPSWNINLDSSSIVRIRVSVGNDDTLSEPFLMAYWSDTYKFSLRNQDDDIAKVLIDTIQAKDTTLNRVQFEVEFRAGDPALQNLSYTTKPSSDIRTFDFNLVNDIVLDVPAKQQLSIPTIGSSICSPTSLSMVLSYYDIEQTPQETASVVFDEGASIYGNWSFNVSVAGSSEALTSRVEYISDSNVLLYYLQNGIPLILSIKTQDKAQLEGSIMAYPAGHLIVLQGIHREDGILYADVNDPAEYENENVARTYLLLQLLDVWNGYAYVIYQEDTLT